MSSLIKLLLFLNWEPKSLDLWLSPQGDRWQVLDYRHSPVYLIQALVDTYNTKQFLRASKHYDSYGIQNGIDFEYTLSLLRTLKAKSQPPPSLNALETALCGACWSDSRVHDAYPTASSICSRCNLEEGTDIHIFWGCPHNKNIDSDAIRDCLLYTSPSPRD